MSVAYGPRVPQEFVKLIASEYSLVNKAFTEPENFIHQTQRDIDKEFWPELESGRFKFIGFLEQRYIRGTVQEKEYLQEILLKEYRSAGINAGKEYFDALVANDVTKRKTILENSALEFERTKYFSAAADLHGVAGNWKKAADDWISAASSNGREFLTAILCHERIGLSRKDAIELVLPSIWNEFKKHLGSDAEGHEYLEHGFELGRVLESLLDLSGKYDDAERVAKTVVNGRDDLQELEQIRIDYEFKRRIAKEDYKGAISFIWKEAKENEFVHGLIIQYADKLIKYSGKIGDWKTEANVLYMQKKYDVVAKLVLEKTGDKEKYKEIIMRYLDKARVNNLASGQFLEIGKKSVERKLYDAFYKTNANNAERLNAFRYAMLFYHTFYDLAYPQYSIKNMSPEEHAAEAKRLNSEFVERYSKTKKSDIKKLLNDNLHTQALYHGIMSGRMAGYNIKETLDRVFNGLETPKRINRLPPIFLREYIKAKSAERSDFGFNHPYERVASLLEEAGMHKDAHDIYKKGDLPKDAKRMKQIIKKPIKSVPKKLGVR